MGQTTPQRDEKPHPDGWSAEKPSLPNSGPPIRVGLLAQQFRSSDGGRQRI
jgi:hypothetical protein